MRRFILASIWAALHGCGGAGTQLADIPVDGGEGGVAPAPRGVGERCDDGGVCRIGLACTAGICQPGRSAEQGASCTISAECKDGLYCGRDRKCATGGAGAQGTTCSSDAECKSGLRCNVVGLSAECQLEGTKDIGGACNLAGDCFGGLVCADKLCAPPPPGEGPMPLGVPSFKGVTCEDDPGDVASYFRVPRGQDDKDFFRLPYPNDIRTKSGKLDLTGFPTPGSDLLGFDLVDRWARYLEQTGTGYSVYPTVTFRFSGEIDFASLDTKGTTLWVDLTTGTELGHLWSATTGRSAYVCQNNVSFRPHLGSPLEPGHKYAVLIKSILKAKGGKDIVVAKDLQDLLGPTDPGGALAAAYAAYAPLRTWATNKSLNVSTIVNAAVFTTGKHNEIAKQLPAAVAASPAPTATSWVKCGTAPSPCAQAEESRACPATPDPAFDELHALVTLPQFQKGTAPFAEEGDFVLDGAGKPVPQGSTQVCMALTVPKTTIPGGGWPLIVYAHGTGGSFRSHITEGLPPRFPNAAILGIDQVGHGTRRGASTEAPEKVFFNFLNPPAARGNVLQGAADQIALVRFAKGLNLLAGASPTGQAIRFGKIAFWGHSQGATEGAVAMPYATDVAGVLLSGEGASLIDSLLTKKSPVNLAAAAPLVLGDLPANVNTVHPALALFQNAIDPADPLDHAKAITTKHVFVPYGQLDTYAPPVTQATYVLAAGLALANAAPSVTTPDDLDRASVALPIKANVNGMTAVTRQYAPSGYDGHFVVFREPDAKTNADRFLADVLAGVVPNFGR
jgi:hypothetical protein